jgi:hypothetical protein
MKSQADSSEIQSCRNSQVGQLLSRMENPVNRILDALQFSRLRIDVSALKVGELGPRYTRDLAYDITWDTRCHPLRPEIHRCHRPKDFLLAKTVSHRGKVKKPPNQGERR